MSVNWNWKLKMGYYKLSQTTYDKVKDPVTGEEKKVEKTEHFTVNLYCANCIAALIFEYKGESDDPKKIDPKTGKRQIVDKYSFQGFWNDLEHLKRCLGLLPSTNWDGIKEKHNIYKEPLYRIDKIYLNIYFKRMLKVAELFAKAGHKVELYYKEIKG